MTNSHAPDATHVPAGGEAYDFVQALAQELATGKVELPSFPEVAMRVQRALSREEVSDADVLRAVGAEPAVAMRVLQMANSVALNPMGKPVLELRSAIQRVGYSMVRAAAMAFVMQQLRGSGELQHLKFTLQQLWERSVTVGSLAMVVARRFTRVNSDAALLAGVLHGVGKLYIITRARKQERLLADRATFDQIVRDWHGSVARALLQNWEISAELIEAVEEHEDLDRDMQGPVALVDVLAVSNLLATFKEHKNSEEADLQLRSMRLRGARVWQRLRIDREGCEAAIDESADELNALRQVLG